MSPTQLHSPYRDNTTYDDLTKFSPSVSLSTAPRKKSRPSTAKHLKTQLSKKFASPKSPAKVFAPLVSETIKKFPGEKQLLKQKPRVRHSLNLKPSVFATGGDLAKPSENKFRNAELEEATRKI
jgi:hypothetical protein